MKNRFVFFWASAVDLLIDSVLGAVWFFTILGLLITGFSLLPVLGVGLLLLLFASVLTRLSGWVERQRASALYDVRILAPVRRVTTQTGGIRFLTQAFLDAIDPVTWRAVLHHLLTMILGFVLIGIASGGIDLALRFSDSWAGLVVGVVAIVLLVAYIYFAGMLDRRLAVTLLGPSRNVQLRERADTLADARQGAVDSAAGERQRIERNLHDGVQPRMVSVAMTLGMARSKFDSDPDAARVLLEQAHAETKASITELRQLARGIHPAVLTDRGLDAALSAVASRCAVPTTISVDVSARPNPEVEAVIYFSVAEALTNVSKHSAAIACRVVVTQENGRVTARIRDDGIGGARVGDGLGQGGLAGMRDRVRAAGGVIIVDSPVGGPTLLTVEVPCAS